MKKVFYFLLGLLQFLIWLVFCGLPAGILFIFHGLWLLIKLVRQVITRKRQCFDDSPVYALIELLILLPMVLSVTP